MTDIDANNSTPEQNGSSKQPALAMSTHFEGKVCVPVATKVQNGRTLTELYLEGQYPPINVHVIGLDSAKTLHHPDDIRRRDRERMIDAFGGISAPPILHRADGEH